MAKFARSGSFQISRAGDQTLFVVPRGINGTLAISNNSGRSYILLLNETITITVRPYRIAKIGSLSGDFPTKVGIRAKGACRGSYIFQETVD